MKTSMNELSPNWKRNPVFLIITALIISAAALLFVDLPGVQAGNLEDASRPVMWHYDLRHTGRTSIVGPIEAPTVEWRFNLYGANFPSSPVIGSDGTIYVGSGGGDQQTGQRFYAINPDGTEKWEINIGAGIRSTPAISDDGTIYFGAEDHYLYAVVDEGDHGTVKWRFQTGDLIRSSPMIAPDGTIYFGSSDKCFYALEDDGDHATEKWRYCTGGYIVASPAIDSDGTVYIGSEDKNLYAINPDGTLKWSFAAGGALRSSPSIGDDGTIYVGSIDGKVYAINPDDGTEKWEFQTTSDSNTTVFSTPAISHDGTIYVGIMAGWPHTENATQKLYAIDSNGNEKWEKVISELVT